MGKNKQFVKLYTLILCLIMFFPIKKLYSQNENIENKDTNTSLANESLNYKGLKPYITSQKNVYQYNEPLYVQLSVLNPGTPLAIILDSVHYSLNYFIEVYTEKGISIKEKDDAFAKRFNLEERLKKLPKEELQKYLASSTFQKNAIIGAQFNLNNIFDLQPGTYIIRLKFYPTTSYFNPFNYVYSSYIQIIIQERDQEYEKEKNLKEQWEKRKLQIKSPQDAIKAFFEGKESNNWDEFFYVIDLQSLIQIFNEFNTSFNTASDDTKFSILNDFKTYLKDLNSDEKITSYNIDQIVIRKNEAIANVVITSYYKGRNLSREYKMKLVEKNHWYITAYTVLQR